MSAAEMKLLTWEASDGYPLLIRRFELSENARAHVIALHGIQSHSGWYEASSLRLAEHGFHVHYMDRRGSGLNMQQRGDTPSGQRLIQDVVEYIREWQTYNAEPIFLSACSWGGKVATLAATELLHLAGLILVAPGFFPKVSVSLGQKMAIARSRLFRPTRMFPIPLNDPKLFTNQMDKQNFIAQDPLTLHFATARFFIESVRLDRQVRKKVFQITMPVLLQLAGHDDIIDSERTQHFLDSWITTDRTIKTYPKGYHTLEFDADPSRFINDQLDWLQSRCVAHTTA